MYMKCNIILTEKVKSKSKSKRESQRRIDTHSSHTSAHRHTLTPAHTHTHTLTHTLKITYLYGVGDKRFPDFQLVLPFLPSECVIIIIQNKCLHNCSFPSALVLHARTRYIK